MHNSIVLVRNAICAGIGALAFVCASSVSASEMHEPAYFLFDGNPPAVKYVSGRLVRLEDQDAQDLESLNELEAVAALLSASRLNTLSTMEPSPIAHISPPRVPMYGMSVFEVSFENAAALAKWSATFVWSGTTPFHEVTLDGRYGAGTGVKRKLIADSHRLLAFGALLDFRTDKSVGTRLEIEGPVNVRDYGRAAAAPHLAFVDITWRIKNLPEVLSNKGIDSLFPFMRVSYVVDTRTGKMVYRDTNNSTGVADRKMRLLKEAGGPLLMAISIGCADGDEPIILDLQHETYGTMRRGDVPPISHCFPAQ